MENTEKDFNPQESIKLIDDMIKTAKGNIKESSFYFLLWGWIVMIGGGGHYILIKFTNYEHPHVAWSVIIIGMILSAIHGVRYKKKTKVTSQIEKIYSLIWFAFLISYFIILFFMSKINYQTTSMIFLIAANATFISGFILKFKPLVFGGIVMWISAIVAFFLSPENQLLCIPITIILGYLIPGYMLKYKEDNNV
ncbi:MAG: hypothetical protein KAT68_00885 [Bacteroidales bacterium]|nr:hypothetical protein [Bacteroidales bacterium]